MAGIKIKRNDTVEVIAGKDKGKRGRVLRVMADRNRLLVEHVMMIKKHVKPNPQRNIKGGIAEQESSIHVSNVMLVDGEGNKTRVGSRSRRRQAGSSLKGKRQRDSREEEVSNGSQEFEFQLTRFTPRIGKRVQSPLRRPWRKRSKIMAARFREKYVTEIRPAIAKELGITNAMAIPKLEKIVINMGLGEATQNVKIMDPLVADLAFDRRSEACHHQGKEVDRSLQGARGHADRRDGYSAR